VTHIHAGRPAFDALVQRTVESIRTMEPGTLVYATHACSDDPRQRIFYELYRDRAAFEAHEQYAHVRTFLADRLAHVESVEVQFRRLERPCLGCINSVSTAGPASSSTPA
jgi:quinol monooxygenase YgiN